MEAACYNAHRYGGNMPLKVRQLKAALSKAGFMSRSAKGSHTYWEHSRYPDLYITISGHDGSDAEKYQERDVKKLIQEAKRRK
jgi:predicted RNA binding protein YcfA (HicA-like mRNA interferase family)